MQDIEKMEKLSPADPELNSSIFEPLDPAMPEAQSVYSGPQADNFFL